VFEQLEASFRALCYKEYWNRVWIVQELLLAKDAMIYCGSKRVTRQAFQYFINETEEQFRSEWEDEGKRRTLGLNDFSVTIHISPAAAIVRGKLAQGEHSQSLRDLLLQYLDQKATNVLDKVYALHGLASDSSDLVIDYRISPEALFIRVLHLECILLSEEGRASTFGEIMARFLKLGWSPEELESQLKLVTEHARIAREQKLLDQASV
jgi:hypothetical protein